MRVAPPRRAGRRLATLALVLVAVSLTACGVEPAPDVSVCSEVAPHAAAVSAPDRRLLGLASEYPPDGTLAGHALDLEISQRARRAAAWAAVARVLAPVELAGPTVVEGATVPRFRTWYDRDDVTRIFRRAYAGLGPRERAARAHLTDEALDDAFRWNPQALDAAPEWTDELWATYLRRIRDGLDVAAVGGLKRITMSPDAARHFLESYPEILRCADEGAPPAVVDRRAEGTQRLAREAIALDRCSSREVGPFHVAAGARVSARLDGDGADAARLRVHAITAGSDARVERCSAFADVGCEVSGPGDLVVEVAVEDVAVRGVLEVDAVAPGVILPGCLRGVFPLATATVAQEWRRVEVGPLPTYDTSAAALAARLAPGAGTTWGGASWGPADGSAEPGPDAIFTLRVSPGVTFRLAGMHIRTRELDHYLNITIWWSPRPDEDFGADRPASVRALGGPWSNYAMCVAIEDVERDPLPTGGFDEDAPTLAAALAAVREPETPATAITRGGRASWCSNPYIDGAPGLMQTNCVGCHQHASSGVSSGQIVMDSVHYPANGRLFVRDNFPADMFWGLAAGDHLAGMIADTVEYWDSAEP